MVHLYKSIFLAVPSDESMGALGLSDYEMKFVDTAMGRQRGPRRLYHRYQIYKKIAQQNIDMANYWRSRYLRLEADLRRRAESHRWDHTAVNSSSSHFSNVYCNFFKPPSTLPPAFKSILYNFFLSNKKRVYA